MSDFPSNKFDRGRHFAKAGLKVGTNYAKYHLNKLVNRNVNFEEKKHLNEKNAAAIYSEFTQLRGTALKIAQSLSMDYSGLLPDEYINIMSQAQYRVPPINKALVRSIIKKELGQYPEQLFKSFETNAIAAASIGQVHQGTLQNGKNAAVKIQYPHIRDTISSDLSMARAIFNRMVKGDIGQYFDEVGNKLLEETDYLHEGKEIEFYADRYTSDHLITPRWYRDLSTDKILTMSFVTGQHLEEFLKTDPGQQERDHFGQLLWNFFHDQINESHTIHADAHPGNFLFTPDKKLGVLDFGCVKKFPRDFFFYYMYALPAHLHNDKTELAELFHKLEILGYGAYSEENDEKNFEFFRSFGRAFTKPYRYDQFDFGDSNFKDEIGYYIKKATTFDEPVGSRHFVYASRVHLGLYTMLMKLHARVNTTKSREIIDNYIMSERPHFFDKSGSFTHHELMQDIPDQNK